MKTPSSTKLLDMPQNSLAIIVVNFRTPELTINCLKSLAPTISQLPNTQVIVVENGSGDTSAEQLATTIRREQWFDWVSLEIMETNLGFAGGCNRGLRAASQTRYALLLNSDTLVRSEAITYCYERMESDQTIGALSCKLVNEDGSVQNVARRFPSPLRLCCSTLGLPWKLPALFEWADTEDRGWDRENICRNVDWLGGAFLFLRGDLLWQLGLLDDAFFFFGEDIELCYRIRKAGYHCRYDPKTEVIHLGAQSSSKKSMHSGWRTQQMWHARYLVQRKCYGSAAETFIRLLDLAACMIRVRWRKVARGSDHPSYHEAHRLWEVLVKDFKMSYQTGGTKN